MSDSILEHLKTALGHLAAGKPKDMADYMKSDAYTACLRALKAAADGEIQSNASSRPNAALYKNVMEFQHMLEHVVHPGVAVAAPNLAAEALKHLGGEKAGYVEVNTAYHRLEKALKVLDGERTAQAAALKVGEAAHMEKVGPIRYAIDLAKRRWMADGNFLEAAPAKVSEAIESALGTACEHGHDHGHDHHHHGHQHAHETKVKPNAAALEEFGGIKLLRTTTQKLAVAGGSTVGLGLVLHGGMNVAAGLRGDAEPQLEIKDLGHEPPASGGANWTRLCVGLAEMAGGAALAYRLLTGRMAFRSPVDGKANSILAHCNHGTPHIGA